MVGSCCSVLPQSVAAGVQKMVMRLLVFKVSSELGKGSEADYRAPALTLLAKSLSSFLYKHSLDFCKPLVSSQGSEKAGLDGVDSLLHVHGEWPLGSPVLLTQEFSCFCFHLWRGGCCII